MFTPLYILLWAIFCFACGCVMLGGGYAAGTLIGAVLVDEDNPRHYGPFLKRVFKVCRWWQS